MPAAISPNTINTAGRTSYAIGIAGIGIQHFFYSAFPPVILPEWPAQLQTPVAAYVVGAAMVILSLLILASKRAQFPALLLGIMLLVFFISFQAPHLLFIVPYQFSFGLWTNALKELALSGGAFIIAASLLINNASLESRLAAAGRIFFSITMLVFGYDHFLYPEFVATLVPSWIPGHMFWTYFAGVALMAAGLAIMFKIMLKQVAFLLAIMLFVWVIVLHIPRAIEDPTGARGNELTSVYQAIAFAGIAMVLGANAKRKPARKIV